MTTIREKLSVQPISSNPIEMAYLRIEFARTSLGLPKEGDLSPAEQNSVNSFLLSHENQDLINGYLANIGKTLDK